MFDMSLLEQDITKREQVKRMPELNTCNDDNKGYEVKAIWNSAVYANKSKSGSLLGLYYLIV